SVPVSSWAYNFYYAGGHIITLTAAGAGDARAVCVERPPVVEGPEYLALTYLGPPTTGSSVWVELRVYDATDTQVAAHRATLAPPG
ncbi:hypothetical protein KBZ21_37140, partial [Streptomyces sp. A73]|nr:hypothetical protein [Streptomyces sp. A73]